MSSSEIFPKVLRLLLKFSGVLRLSEAFSYVLSGCQSFLKVLTQSLIFWGVQRHKKRSRALKMLLHIPEGSDPFNDVLGCAEVS